MAVRRVQTVWDLPLESVRCGAAGRHIGFLINDAHVSAAAVPGWGDLDARDVLWSCTCSRTKRQVIDWDTGETLSRSDDYDGGVLTVVPFTQHEARLVLLRRQAAARSSGRVVTFRGPR